MARLDRVTLIAFLACVLLGGLNAVGVRYTVLELPPLWGAALRFGPASALLFLVVLARRLPLPRRRSLLGALIYGVLNGISFCFLYWGLLRAQPGLSSVVLALSPLMTLLMAVAYRQESLRWPALAGSLLAAAGVSLVFGEQLRAQLPVLNLLALVAGAVCLSWASVIIKGYPMGDPTSTNAIATGAGALVLLALSLLLGESHVLPVRPETWSALGYLILFGTALLFVLILFVLKRWTASATSYITVLFPFITISASALLGQERLSPALLAGALLVMAGVYVGAIRPASRQMPAPPAGLKP